MPGWVLYSGTIMHNLDDVLEVWRSHFSSLCTPKSDPVYDDQHFNTVNEHIESWLKMGDSDDFLCSKFNEQELSDAILKLNSGKAPGMDNVTAEHLKFGGRPIVRILVTLCNWIVDLEYIPVNFREGIQVPLHKGKNASTTNPDNFRGITLLNTYSKIFEILIWTRMEAWWLAKITPLQGAGRKGVSCLHTAMMLQETISSIKL